MIQSKIIIILVIKIEKWYNSQQNKKSQKMINY